MYSTQSTEPEEFDWYLVCRECHEHMLHFIAVQMSSVSRTGINTSRDQETQSDRMRTSTQPQVDGFSGRNCRDADQGIVVGVMYNGLWLGPEARTGPSGLQGFFKQQQSNTVGAGELPFF